MKLRSPLKDNYLHVLIMGLLIIVIIQIFILIQSKSNQSQLNKTNLIDQQNTAIKDVRKHINELISSEGAENSYATIKQQYANYDYGFQHEVAHIFGELLYDKFGINAVSICDDAFQFGCFHAFFTEAIAQKGLGISTQLSLACQNSNSKNTVICEHGVGHGIAAFNGPNKLLDSLSYCDKVFNDTSLSGCLNGVFMEYNFNTKEDPSGSGLMARKLDPNNPFEPCKSLQDKYQPACYYQQASWWVQVYNAEYLKVGSLCDTLQNPANSDACFRGLGTSVASHALYDVTKIDTICKSFTLPNKKALCYAYAATSLNSLPQYKEKAAQLCELPGNNDKAICLLNIGK